MLKRLWQILGPVVCAVLIVLLVSSVFQQLIKSMI